MLEELNLFCLEGMYVDNPTPLCHLKPGYHHDLVYAALRRFHYILEPGCRKSEHHKDVGLG